MSCRILTLTDESTWSELLNLLAGRVDPKQTVEADVRVMLDAVLQGGDTAVLDYTRRFDCPDMALPLRIPAEELDRATIAPESLRCIREAADNIRAFHEAQKDRSWFLTREDGTVLGQQITPVDRVGLYVPGGKGGETPLISSLLMTAIPAQVAGVREIAVVSPPRKDGTLNPHILATARLLGLTELYRMGGAWAVGALAYGTASVPSVDVIAGPGNIWVATAKRLVQGRVGIDMIAGPSEVLILADGSARPDWIAADMLSQAEHDTLASAICLTADRDLATAVLAELERQVATLPRAAIAQKALADWSAVALVPDMDVAITLANRIAPEHLEVLMDNPWSVLPRIRNAGAVFLGAYAPEPLGDYFAGPNHVLPTLGTARFSSALSVQTFCKRTSVIAASPAFAQHNADTVACLARMECLEAHARSMESRKECPTNNVQPIRKASCK
ncbi:MAG: histidinol dehydrogenase [Bilophila sp.]